MFFFKIIKLYKVSFELFRFVNKFQNYKLLDNFVFTTITKNYILL